MATVNLTLRYANLADWPGRLFEADASTTVQTRTATQFSVRHGAGSEFEGYRVVVTGTGFTYVNGVPSGGTISQVQVLNKAGSLVVTIGNLAGSAGGSDDLSLLAYNMFGSRIAGVGPEPDGKAAWSHLLSGNDVITGTSGNDMRGLVGLNAGDDTFVMRAGRDMVHGGLGHDTIRGGAGVDTLSYAETHYNEGNGATQGVSISVGAGSATDAWGFTDIFYGIESFYGSVLNDRFVGADAGADLFAGLRGADRIDGGADSLGPEGAPLTTGDLSDQASYRNDYEYGGRFGIRADLQTGLVGSSIRGVVRDGFGTLDVVRDIERIEGTRLNDVMIGSEMANRFRGGEGRDRFNGMAGQDEVDFSVHFGNKVPATGVRVNLTLANGQIVNDGFGNTEDAISIEDVIGSDRGDTIRGNGRANKLQGMDGTDVLRGGGGSDTFVWTTQKHLDDGDRLVDFQARDSLAFEVDAFVNMNMTLNLVNGAAARTTDGTFIFNGATDKLIWDSNGSAAGGRSVVAIITTVDTLQESNFQLWD